METPDLDVCRVLAAKHGLPLQFIVKDFCLMDVLSQLAANQGKFGKIMFKGGTALNKAYLEGVQRFSEDLDFDVETDSAGAKSICGKMAGMLTGYKTGEIRKVGSTYQFECACTSILGGSDHVRVDVAPKKIITDKKPVLAQVSSPYSQKSVAGVPTYGLEDLVARKLCALESRTEGKDMYDAYSSLPLCGKMHGALAAMLRSEGRKETPAEFIEKAVGKVKGCDAKKAGNLTNPFIPYPNRPKSWLGLKNSLVIMLEEIDV
jgi:predicted nucleotidyltransferase component of viral defense system